ncbi:MAG: NUDIX hydrolase [Candidatus Saccharimonadales bacterium]
MKHFYVGIKAIIIRGDKVLLLKDSSRPDFWDVPGGRIDDNESIEQALLRELKEELPSHSNPRIGELLNAYRIPGSIKDDLGLVLLFYRVDIDIADAIALSDEHTDYEWVSFEEALKRGSDGIKSTMQKLLRKN